MFGQIQTTLNFYFYGKSRFTKTGYVKNVAKYKEPNFLEEVDLSGRVYMITGANSGIGKEMALYVAKKGATVFMVCRSPERAIVARDDVIEKSKNENVVFLQADVGLEKDVRRVMQEFSDHPLACSNSKDGKTPQLNSLVCNAGALLHKRQLTSEGQETTFASHLLFGSYLLGDLALPILKKTKGGRMIMVSSGGMYNYKMPSWEILSSTHDDSINAYDGQKAYAYAKRGQVLLAEKWNIENPEVPIVTAHPGWTLSEGVEAAYGDSKSWLEPLRTCWEGAEGICWLMTCPTTEIQGGEFYLDRKPQPKHIAGSFFYEGTATKNTVEEIDLFHANLFRWGSADAKLSDTDLWRPTPERTEVKLQARLDHKEVKATDAAFDLQGFMKKWHILANIPIMLADEQKLCNAYEDYSFDEKNEMIKVNFTSTPLDSQTSQLAQMHGYVKNKPINSHWSLNPKIYFYLPLGLDYIMIHVEENFEWCVVGVPSRANVWIMTNNRPRTKDAFPWPSDCQETYRNQMGCQGVSGAIVDCKQTDDVDVVYQGDGKDYTNAKSPNLTAEAEKEILRKGVLIAEKNGYDISQIRMVGWRNDLP